MSFSRSLSRRAFGLGLGALVSTRFAAAHARTLAPDRPEATPLTDFRFERLLEPPVHSVALGPKGDVAAVGQGAFLHRNGSKPGTFEALPDPKVPLAGAQIFLGRDHLPRLMGTMPAPAGSAAQVHALYRRYRNGTWIPAPKELGSLAKPDEGALEGILGDDDPEVVTKVGRQCLVKRRTGWTPLPALPAPAAYAIANGEAWAYAAGQLHHFDKKAIAPVGSRGAFDAAVALAAASPNQLWALSAEPAGPSELFSFDGSDWRSSPCPEPSPRAVAALASGTLWLGGETGLHQWDGSQWRKAEAAPGSAAPLAGVRAIAARSAGEVWVAGATGLWRGKRDAGDQGATSRSATSAK